MNSLIELLGMGPHGPYVWGSYLIVTVVLVWNVAAPLHRARKLREELRRQPQSGRRAP
jgi:heme exporter protein CcmD